jgi:DNA-binding NarL/FixJ family response regulator
LESRSSEVPVDAGELRGEDSLLERLRSDLRAENAALIRVDGGGSYQLVASARPFDLLAAATAPERVVLALPIDGPTAGVVDIAWSAGVSTTDMLAERIGRLEADLLALLRRSRSPRRRILVCHEDALIAGGLARELEGRQDTTVETALTFPDALRQVRAIRPELIVCSDAIAPEGLPEIARRLREAGAAGPLLVLARLNSAQSFEDALEAGATGYLPLAAVPERLHETIEELLAGRSVLRANPSEASVPRLTRREREVLLACERGLSHKQIARDLEVAVSTVKTHARSMYAKLDASSRTDALHKARQVGLIA